MTDLHARVVITAVDRFSSAMGSIGNKVAGTGKKIEKAGVAMRNTGLGMTAAFTLPAVGLMRQAVKLDDAMGDLEKVFVGSDAQMAAMDRTIGAMATKTLPLAHTQITKLFTAANQAGIAFKDQKDWVQLAGDFMVAFDTTAERSALTLAQMKQTLGLTTPELREMAGAMNIVANNSAATEEQLLGVYEQVAPLVKFIGGKKAAMDLAALGGVMVGGMLDPEKAGTGLRSIITRVIKPTKEVESGFDLISKKVAGFNMNAGQMAKMMKTDLSGAFMKLYGSLVQMDRTDALKSISSIAGLRGQDTAIPFLTALPKSIQLLEQVGNRGLRLISVHEEAKKKFERLTPQLQFFQNSLERVGFAVTKVWKPHILQATDTLSEFADRIDEGSPAFQTAAKSFGALAALGPGLAVSGYAIEGIGKSMHFFGRWGLRSPVGVTVAGLGAAVYAVGKNWEQVEPSWNRMTVSANSLGASLGGLARSSGIDVDKLLGNWDEDTATGVARLFDELATSMNNLRGVVERPLDWSTWDNFIGIEVEKGGLADKVMGWFSEDGEQPRQTPNIPDASVIPGVEAAPPLPSSAPRAAKRSSLSGPDDWWTRNVVDTWNRMIPSWQKLEHAKALAQSRASKVSGPSVPIVSRVAESPDEAPLLRDLGAGGKLDLTGKVNAELRQPVPVDVTGKVDAEVDLKGKADVHVRVAVEGPGRVTGMSSSSSGDIRLNTGVSMQDTGVTP